MTPLPGRLSTTESRIINGPAKLMEALAKTKGRVSTPLPTRSTIESVIDSPLHEFKLNPVWTEMVSPVEMLDLMHGIFPLRLPGVAG